MQRKYPPPPYPIIIRKGSITSKPGEKIKELLKVFARLSSSPQRFKRNSRSPINFSHFFILTFLFFTSALSQLASVKAQVVIRDSVEIMPADNNGNSFEFNVPTGAGTSVNVRAELTFNQFSYPWPPPPYPNPTQTGYIEGAIKFYITSPWSNFSSSGNVSISGDFSPPEGGQIQLWIGWSMQTSLGHTPGDYNIGNANEVVEIYVDDEIYINDAGEEAIFTYSNYSGGSTVLFLKPKVCGEDAPVCDGEPEAPEIIINESPNLAFGNDICQDYNQPGRKQLGGFAPVPGKHIINPIIVHPCFDKDNNIWKFNVNDIEINTILDLCPDWLSNFRVIDNVSEVDENDICDALEDFDDHKPYPLEVRSGGYLLRPVLLMHEEMHKKLFENYMKKNKAILDQKILNYQPPCEEFNSYFEAQEEGTNKLTAIVKEQLTKNYNRWRWETGKDKLNPNHKWLDDQNEQNTHAKVQLLIIQYKQELKRLYGSWVWCI